MMKSLLFLILSLFATLSAQAQGEPQFLETFKPVERTHDFGTIYEKDGKVVHVFRLRNNARVPWPSRQSTRGVAAWSPTIPSVL